MKRLVVVLAALLAGVAHAADGPERHQLPEGLADASCVVLVPSRGLSVAHLPGGVEEDVSLLIVDGRIQQVGRTLSGVSISDGAAAWRGGPCALVDISGKTVTPGLIEVNTRLGLVEVSLESGTVNTDEGGGDAVRSAHRVAEAYDPRSTLIPVTRMEGVTTAVIAPSGGMVAGQLAAVDLAGDTQADAIFAPSVAMAAALGGESRSGAVGRLRELFEDVRAYSRNKAGYERNASRELVASRADLEALIPVLEGRLPLVIGASRAADLEALIRLKRDLGLRLIVVGGEEAWVHAEALAEAEIPVILQPLSYGGGGFDQRYQRQDNAARLAAAGVTIGIASGSAHNSRLLRQAAGNAVRFGLDHDAAIVAMTQTPAALFGLEDRGRLAVGQVANVTIWDGDPLEVTTSVAGVFIGGRAIPLDSRQWRLLLRYTELPGTPVPALSLP